MRPPSRKGFPALGCRASAGEGKWRELFYMASSLEDLGNCKCSELTAAI